MLKLYSRNIIFKISFDKFDKEDLEEGFILCYIFHKLRKPYLFICLSISVICKWKRVPHIQQVLRTIKKKTHSHKNARKANWEREKKCGSRESLMDEKSEILPSGADIFYYRAMCPLGIIFGLADFPQLRLQLTTVQMNELQDLINPVEVWKTISYAALIFQWISEIFKIVCPIYW